MNALDKDIDICMLSGMARLLLDMDISWYSADFEAESRPHAVRIQKIDKQVKRSDFVVRKVLRFGRIAAVWPHGPSRASIAGIPVAISLPEQKGQGGNISMPCAVLDGQMLDCSVGQWFLVAPDTRCGVKRESIVMRLR
jgi:hypothetical protein